MIQLTDEEILHALEHCEDCVGCAHCIYTHKNVECNNTNDAVKLIHRLQSDLETCSNIEKQEKATNYELRIEIERLTEREKFLENAWHTSIEHTETIERGLKASEARSAELQKQVDELKERAKIDLENEKNWGKIQTKQAVKDTAKEICDLILEHWEKKQFVECDWLRVAIAEKYGVEVE